MPDPTPFHPSAEIPTSDVTRLLSLVKDSRTPADVIPPSAGDAASLKRNEKHGGWEWGTPRSYMQEMRRIWLEEWSFERDLIQKLEKYPNFTTTIEGMKVHFLHVRSERPDAKPLILSHGWPSSVLEFVDLIPLLVDPPGGQQAYHVVAPSLPGFAFSSQPNKLPWSVRETAHLFDILMQSLGYSHFYAHGGDWGARVTLALLSHASCQAAHVTLLPASPPLHVQILGSILLLLFPKFLRNIIARRIWSDEELWALSRTKWWMLDNSAYLLAATQRPSTLGMALSDSPTGLLSYIGEGFSLLSPLSKPYDAKLVLSTVSLYHLTSCFASSYAMYKLNHPVAEHKDPLTAQKGWPLGLTAFKYDVLAVPLSWAKRSHPGLCWTRSHDRGGHFAAVDEPQLLAKDLSDFFTAAPPRKEWVFRTSWFALLLSI